MKTAKQMLSMIAVFFIALFAGQATGKSFTLTTQKLGIPYSLSYIAQHSNHGVNVNYDNVIFHETASEGGLYRTFDWHVTFEQNGAVIAEFSTNDSSTNWITYSNTDEKWNGSTAYVPSGTYTVRISDISGVGNFYEMYAGGVYAGRDINTTREDGVMEGVVVESSGYIDVGVNRVR
ncbi:hypothetical protein [uncultured Mucilaginibacter sp.]|uniref:hypothetical protein n=1 Tax=uncultured Mucilaginibacter sp. TaxID=797541 RepID=UPI0025F08F57|nr:hypothetical protein [uncultured Mucilaginibacter sp.]